MIAVSISRYALVAALAVAPAWVALAGPYDPLPGAYSPGQDPKTLVSPGQGVGTIRFGQNRAVVGQRVFGPARRTLVIRGNRRYQPGWSVGDYGAIRVVARAGPRATIVAFVITGRGYQTQGGVGVGSTLSTVQTAFGKGRRAVIRRGSRARLWRFTVEGTTILARLTPGTPLARARVTRWVLARDRFLPLTEALLRG